MATKRPGDTVSISRPAAALARQGILDNLFGFEPETPGRYTIREIAFHARRFLSEFTSDFRSLLHEEGICLDTPIELGHAPDGRVVVKNGHPDKEAIEAVFTRHPELRNEYTKITSMLGLVENAKEAGAFHQAYRKDPRAAVARYACLFTTSVEAGLRISKDGTDVVLNRQTRREE